MPKIIPIKDLKNTANISEMVREAEELVLYRECRYLGSLILVLHV